MNTEEHEVTAFSPILGWALVAASGAMIVGAAVRNLDEPILPFAILAMMVIAIPIMMLAEDLGATVTISGQAIWRRGLWGKRKEVPWSEVRLGRFQTGRGSVRTIVLVAGGKKVVFSTFRRGFWPAADTVLQAARTHDVQIKWGFASNEARFFEARGASRMGW